MDRFKKEIIINNEPRSFDFMLMKNMSGTKFFITSKDANKKPISFSLVQTENGNWKLWPGSLRWLYEIEGELSDAILERGVKE